MGHSRRTFPRYEVDILCMFSSDVKSEKGELGKILLALKI